jgi:hypothetical protein
MRKATDARESDDLGRVRRLGFGESTCWGIANRRVDPIAVGVPDELSEQASEGVFAEHDDVIEQLPANAPHEALRGPVLPRASGITQRADGCLVTLQWRTRRLPGSRANQT